MITVGIVGISGYSGYQLLDILLRHPEVRVTYVSAHSTVGPVEELWPQLRGRTRLVCEAFDVKKAAAACQLIFLAVPHGAAMAITPGLLKAGLKVIDLSGDYRLKRPALYTKWYGLAHSDPRHLSRAVYGLPELYREKIRKAQLISNPGCYPTAALLGLLPLAGIRPEVIESIIIDAKSGVSGAGKKVSGALMFCEVHESFKAYKVLTHQHTPEIELYLGQAGGTKQPVTFVTHLLPVNRGILETMYVRMKTRMSAAALHSLYKKFYKTEPFVRVLPLDIQPELKNVVGTNYCDIGLTLDSGKGLLVVTSVIDNLVKGAAGQAVQNMNILCGFPETTALL